MVATACLLPRLGVLLVTKLPRGAINIMEKQFEFAVKVLSAIQTCFDEESDNFIPKEELMEGNNLTHFIHALANIAPAMAYNQITGEDLNSLDFNHVANKLCFQYSSKESGVSNG